MGQVLGAMLFLAAVLGVAGEGLATLGELQAAAAAFAADWSEEYALRRCAQLAAADANLRDSAEYLALLNPAWRERLDRGAGTLSAGLQADYAPVSPSADAAGSCRTDGRLGLAAALHRQRHPGQPAHWPNWVSRFVPRR